jgi:hypothetical protein
MNGSPAASDSDAGRQRSPRARPRFDPAALERIQELADYTVPILIRLLADFGVPDRLADGPRSVEALAAAVDVQPAPLRLALQALAARGVFEEVAPDSFANTALSETLRSDHPLSLRRALPLVECELHAWTEFRQLLASGATPFDRFFGQPYYDYMASHHEQSDRVDLQMQAITRLHCRQVLSAVGWPENAVLVDIAGGTGAFLAELLARRPGCTGILFDRPHVVANAPPFLAAAGVAARCRVLAGDFFEAVPPGGDVYILKTVLGALGDEDAKRVLSRIHAAMKPGSRLLVMNPMSGGGGSAEVARAVALHTLVLTGIYERSVTSAKTMLAACGFGDIEVIPTAAFPILDARAS